MPKIASVCGLFFKAVLKTLCKNSWAGAFVLPAITKLPFLSKLNLFISFWFIVILLPSGDIYP